VPFRHSYHEGGAFYAVYAARRAPSAIVGARRRNGYEERNDSDERWRLWHP
jgi:hypothetical protein